MDAKLMHTAPFPMREYQTELIKRFEQQWCALCGCASQCKCAEAEAHAERVYKKVTGIIGTVDVQLFVWKAAFHQAALEEGIAPKSEMMSQVVFRCMYQRNLENKP